MDSLTSKNFPRLRLSLGLLLLVVVGILAVGLNPRGLSLYNDIHRDAEGIRFGEYGVAYTEPFLTSDQSRQLAAAGFTIHTAFELPDPPADGFNIIALVHNGDDRSQLLIGQWRHHLIVMNGDDYDHRRGTPRLSIDTSQMDADQIFLSLTVGARAPTASLYLNGVLRQANENIKLTLPAGDSLARLVLGNSVYADSSFQGRLSWFAILDQALGSEEVQRHYEQWQQGTSWPFDGSGQTLVSYRFGDQFGDMVEVVSEQRMHLEIPACTTAVKRRLLAPPSGNSERLRDSLSDIVVNLLGFVPFGFLATVVLRRAGRRGVFVTLFIVILAGALLSCGIETAQSWMPSRSSTLIDLLLNTAGTAAGSALALLVRRSRLEVREPLIHADGR